MTYAFRKLPYPVRISEYSVVCDTMSKFDSVPRYSVVRKGKCIASCLSYESADAVANMCDYVDALP